MRIANVNHRATLTDGDRHLDIHVASEGAFGPDPMDIYTRWADFTAWAATITTREISNGFKAKSVDILAPSPRPRQIFAIGVNYRDHADEAAIPYPENLIVFTKSQSSLAGADVDVVIPDVEQGELDYETELVVTIGREAHKVSETNALDYVAGYSVGQDLSERSIQLRPPVPQFSLGKSFPNFSPVGPAVVTLDEFKDPNALRISAVLEGPQTEEHGRSWTVQDGTTASMVFPVANIIADLSQVVTLFPGDLIFTGTPAGVGKAHGIAMQPGNVLTSTLEGVGSIRNTFIK